VASESPEPEEYRPPPYHLTTWALLGAGLVFVLGLISVRTDYQPDTSRDYPSRALLPDAEPVLLEWEPRNDEYFPCNDCHGDDPPNPTQRELEEEHYDWKLAHGDLWCLRCHALNDRDNLHLSDGTLVPFEESWRLCTQCHGKKLADWRAGVHGKRTGHWLGTKEYRTCVVCHDPHSPPFERLEPKPPPLRPTQITLNGNAPEEISHEEH
jgi:hypothetical protein